jgi:hypothetical protein
VFDILTIIPGKKKTTAKGWISFNAPCCHHRGHRPDKRMRGGIKFDDDINWSYHCFNCDFKCRFTLGKSISRNLRLLLSYYGVSDELITKYSFESLQQKDLIDYVKVKRKKLNVVFKETELPENAILIDENNIEHKKFADYICDRGLNLKDYPFMITPNDEGRNSNRIIVPYTMEGKLVGHISRYLDNRIPKYIKEQQTGYVFGIDLQKPNYEVCIVVEGIFDALSINGCALTHDTISDEQAEILRRLNRKIIVVPDLDKSGMNICERALELGFHVSIPNWSEEIKDTNDAIRKYGKVPTLLSILQSATNSKIKIEMQRNKIAKRI